MKTETRLKAISITMPFSLKIKLNIKIILFFILLVVFSLFIFSIYQFNIYTNKTYLIHGLERRIDKFIEENKVLEINLAEVNSLENIGSYVHNFEKTERIEYIRILEGTALAK